MVNAATARPVVGRRQEAYVIGPAGDCRFGDSVMPVIASPARAPVLWIAFAVGGGLFAAAAVLWGYYGTALFFETLRAGLAACF